MKTNTPRRCRRSLCGDAAVATLTFRYASAQAWLEDLAPEPEPQRWDLCADHAEALTVPVGWDLVDARTPAGATTGGEVVHLQARRRNRYAELSARLPELAAQVAAETPLLAGSSVEAADDRLPLASAGSLNG